MVKQILNKFLYQDPNVETTENRLKIAIKTTDAYSHTFLYRRSKANIIIIYKELINLIEEMNKEEIK